MTTIKIQQSKEMKLLIAMPCFGPVWLVINRTRFYHCPDISKHVCGCRQDTLKAGTLIGHGITQVSLDGVQVWKVNIKSVSLTVNPAFWVICRGLCWIHVCGLHGGWLITSNPFLWQLLWQSFCHSGSTVALRQSLLFWRWYLSLFTLSHCQHRLIVASFRRGFRTIVSFVQSFFFNLTERPLSISNSCL